MGILKKALALRYRDESGTANWSIRTLAKTALAQSSYQQLELGRRRYELSNHLGNVLATVSDKSLGQDSSQTGQADYYLAQVSSANLYYPFGWEMPGRKFVSGEDYRFGFNGVEDDRDWGTQNIQDYGFRLYNPSIGKFLSVDPLSPDYPWYTPYQFAGNMPIWAVDLDGLEEQYYGDYMKHIIDGATSLFVQKAEDMLGSVGESLRKVPSEIFTQTLDKRASNAMENFSRYRDSEVKTYGESEKQEIFKTDADKTANILLYEYATQTGPTERVFDEKHAITKDLSNVWYIKSDIFNAVQNKGFDVVREMEEGQFFSVGIEFSPNKNPLSWPKSYMRHFAATSSSFFIGGAIAYVSYDKENDNVNVKIVNVTSRNSLMLHMGENYYEKGKLLASKWQYFKFSYKMKDIELKAKKDANAGDPMENSRE
ncbi:RHS repeat domain-containing protein [Saprospira grandis]|uniref:RHS repeat domain-containing protein n=1 Tax=Saprospira grandis TaxID=1008 RepID=UPI0009D95A71|nr:RHS repeat-associated core domain-containing protein [Saprospira grandis]